MLSALYRIGSGLMLESQRQELISQNLAGAGLCGFKGRHLNASSFQQQVDQLGDQADLQAYGVDSGTVVTDFTQAGLSSTQRSLDFALVGNGFFQVQMPDGNVLLTRNGNFTLSPEGALVTQEGYSVLGQGGPIQFNPADVIAGVQVSEDGTITVPDGTNGTAMRTVGILSVGIVEEPDSMIRISANYFRPADGQDIEPATQVKVCNGFQEQSNISPVREMAAMIQSLREFESGQKMIQTMNELSRDANQKTL